MIAPARKPDFDEDGPSFFGAQHSSNDIDAASPGLLDLTDASTCQGLTGVLMLTCSPGAGWVGCGSSQEPLESMASPDTGPPVETDSGSTGDLFEDASRDGGSCVGTSFAATKPSLDLFVMLDQSSSMNEIAGDATRWDAVASALSTFIQQPETAGIGFRLQYFGLPQHSADGGACEQTPCTNDAECGLCGPCDTFFHTCGADVGAPSCWVPDYARAEIEIQPLPGVAQAVMASLRDHSFPWTRTPTSASPA